MTEAEREPADRMIQEIPVDPVSLMRDLDKMKPGESILVSLKDRTRVMSTAKRHGIVMMSHKTKDIFDDPCARIWRIK